MKSDKLIKISLRPISESLGQKIFFLLLFFFIQLIGFIDFTLFFLLNLETTKITYLLVLFFTSKFIILENTPCLVFSYTPTRETWRFVIMMWQKSRFATKNLDLCHYLAKNGQKPWKTSKSRVAPCGKIEVNDSFLSKIELFVIVF